MTRHKQAKDIEETGYLGSNIRFLRERDGKTLDEVGNAIPCTGMTISKYERGKSYPDKETLKKLADYFGIDQEILKSNDLRAIEGMKVNLGNIFDFLFDIVEEAAEADEKTENVESLQSDIYYQEQIDKVSLYFDNPKLIIYKQPNECIDALNKLYRYTNESGFLYLLLFVYVIAWISTSPYLKQQVIDAAKLDTNNELNLNKIDVIELSRKKMKSYDHQESTYTENNTKSIYLKYIYMTLGKINKVNPDLAHFFAALLNYYGINETSNYKETIFGIEELEMQSKIGNKYADEFLKKLYENIYRDED